MQNRSSATFVQEDKLADSAHCPAKATIVYPLDGTIEDVLRSGVGAIDGCRGTYGGPANHGGASSISGGAQFPSVEDEASPTRPVTSCATSRKDGDRGKKQDGKEDLPAYADRARQLEGS
ncbi:hypothetical protein NM688_g8388 [Phlebia brevispora]|uniref:Uncharacterized protein n=1 Tax=Phlebia brevispora TaxID=194682 RepID=A0ACC1RSB2_9APHY|nr:hypothetical protein NM688_g8388 [Phlebia brevispora]